MSRKIERFAAPPLFEETYSVGGRGAIDLQNVSSSRKEIWLLKTPAYFDGKELNGVMLNLSGDPVEFSCGVDDDRKYEACGVASLKENEAQLPYLLVPSPDGKTFEPAPALKGQITIVESLNLPSSDRLSDIQPSKVPDIPEGLRARFRPFGWEEPRGVSNRDTCISPLGAAGSRRREPEDNQDSQRLASATELKDNTPERQKGSKKMKRKSEKEGVPLDDVPAKQQNLLMEGDSVSNPKKKKKKKKTKD